MIDYNDVKDIDEFYGLVHKEISVNVSIKESGNILPNIIKTYQKIVPEIIRSKTGRILIKSKIYEQHHNNLMREHVLKYEKKYKHLYSNLNDEKSRRTLLCILDYRFNGTDFEKFHRESDFIFNQYFDKDIMKFATDETFVDCGGYVGDTSEMFLNHVDTFSKIYIYEPEKSNYNMAKEYFMVWRANDINKIILRNAGVGIENKILKINSGGAGSHISESGDYEIRIVSIDEDINEQVSFIKMDIEGFELDAIDGAKRHITEERPKLAICVYHKTNDLWEIQELIEKLNQNYTYYLRQYKYGDGQNTWETVLYAV